MTKAPSLAIRVIVLLAVAQLPAFLAVWLALTARSFAEYENLDVFLDGQAIGRTTDLVAESLIKNRDGLISIEPTPALRTEMLRAPNLQFAAFDPVQWTPLAGSSEELASALSGFERFKLCHLHFSIDGSSATKANSHLACRNTPLGRVPIAVYGQKFLWYDIFDFFQVDQYWMLLNISTGILATTVTAWFAVRHGLRPLANVVREAERIEMNSLDQRLSTSGVPVEIRNIVDVVNDALKRLDFGVERQRRFAANAAHELRTPLAVMRARLENAKASSLRNELLGDASQLRSIVEQMLVSTRLAEGQVALDQRVNLDKTVRQLVSDLVPLAMDRDRFLDFEGAPSPLVTRGNQRAIQSVLTNLIDNALREEPKGGTVCVRTDDDGVIAVIDHGEGVASADREMIFERFWRKSDATSGTGLGLAISKDIMDAHGGHIWVEETPGGGATFKLWFPTVGEGAQDHK